MPKYSHDTLAWRDSKQNCAYCRCKLTKYSNRRTDNSDAAVIDHFVPRSRGGRNCPTNYYVVCHKCNARKSNFLPRDYIGKLDKKIAKLEAELLWAKTSRKSISRFCVEQEILGKYG